NELTANGTNSDMESIIEQLVSISDPDELAAAYEGVAPGAYGAASQVALDMTQLGLRTLQRHNYRLRSDLRERRDAAGVTVSKPMPREQVWYERFRQTGDQDSEADYTGWDYNVSGGTWGLDYRMSNKWLLGAAYITESADLSVDVGPMQGGISAKIGALYSNYLARHYYLEASLAKGDYDFSQRRAVHFAGISNMMESLHSGESTAASLRVGMYASGRFGFEPYLSLLHAAVDEDPFEETGAGSLDLNVNSHTTKSTVVEVGAHFKYKIRSGGGYFIPDLGLAYAKEIGNGNNDVTAVFSGAPDDLLTVKTPDRGDRFLLNTGFTFTGSGGTSFEARYFSEFKSGYKNQGGMAALFLEF
ncbi:MAG: autotransporter outer membrane beta-barrel domain-containing protein, partial [Armatimonadia bacterium]